jgi:hypothetical protein
MTWKGIYTYRQRWKTTWTIPRYIGLVQWLAFACVPYYRISAVVSRKSREWKCVQSNSACFSFVNIGKQVHLKHARRHFKRILIQRRAPSKCCIQKLVKKLETTGSLPTQHAGGRKMSEETIHDVKERLLASPSKSLRRLFQETYLPYFTCQRAARKAKLRAYLVSCVQELLPMDHGKRVRIFKSNTAIFVA